MRVIPTSHILQPNLLRQISPSRIARGKCLLPQISNTHFTRQSHQLTRYSPSSAHIHVLPFFTSKRVGTSGKNDDSEDREHRKKVNLGSMIDYLNAIIPEALNTVPDASKLDEHIQLRISPTISNVPVIKGRLSYLTSLKATQLIFKNFILDHTTKLHVLKEEVDYSDSYGILGSGVAKIVIHWKTCDEVCRHVGDAEHIRKDVVEHEKHRVLHGIFVFELNRMHDKILVHNVENLEICNDHENKINDIFGEKFAPSAY